MDILTNENVSYNVDLASSDSKSDIRYCSLDLSNVAVDGGDFYFYPLVFLENIKSKAVVLEINKHKISIPYDWYILIGDAETGEMELVAIEDLNNRDLTSPVLNPLTSFLPTYQTIKICDIYNDVEWFFPKLNANNLLVVPLTHGSNPQCVFFINEINGKKLDQISSSIFYGGN